MLSPLSADPSAPPQHGTQNHERCLVHFDIDCFYAQVEEVLDPSLRGKPVGIRQKYLLVTCNYTARSLGVRKMESLVEAKRRCPSLIVMDGEDLTRYREASEAIFSYVAGVCGPMVQRLGMDEIFADVTQLIRCGPLGSGRSSGGGDNESDAGGITGHLFSPGTGGTLLEAQTGLQISLDVGGGSGGERFEAEDRDTSGMLLGNDGQDPHKKLPAKTAADTFGLYQEGRFSRSNDLLASQGRAGGMAKRDSPVTTTVGGSNGGSGSWSRSSGEVVGGTENGDSRGGGLQGPVVVGRRRDGERICQCGCFERLSATSAFAEHVRKGLLEVVGYTCSAGIGCSKMAAKLAGELHKPAQQTTILPQHVMSMTTQLPLRKLPGCGYSTCAKLKAELGITESHQLQAAPWPLLVRAVGLKVAKVLFLLCRGEDDTPVVPSVRPKTMSDEDSFKRGTIRSRHQVEHHIRRLATPLLLRAGERARLHREAPEALRFGFRRASKGYGVRVSRQCAVSSGVAAAWAAAAGVAVPSAAATEETGAGVTAVSAASVGLGGSPTTTAPSNRVEQEQQQQQQQQRQRQQNEQQKGREKYGGEPEKALYEVVRLAMAMFDKMVSPRETLDLTLISVGFAGFRGLEGGAQSGMARYLDASQQSRQGGGDGNGSSSSSSSSRGRKNVSTTTRLLSEETTMPASATPGSRANPIHDSITSVSLSASLPPPLHTESSHRFAKVSAAEAAAAAAASRGVDANAWREGAGKKRLRVPENPYRLSQQQQRRQRERSRLAKEYADTGPGTEDQHDRTTSRGVLRQDVARADAWDGAEVLVVGEGGKAVPGRGRLDWCGVCGVHVLRADSQEHASSGFHRGRSQLREPG